MPETLGILNYFDTTYVNGPPIARKVHDASLTGSSRTNNVCESWNNSYRNLRPIGHAHPCVWTSIDAICKDQAAASTTLYQQRSGQPQRKGMRDASRANSSATATATALQRICRWGARRAAISAIILKSIFLRLNNI